MQLEPSAFVADPELVLALTQRSTPLDCDTDRILFRQGDASEALYILQKGTVTLEMISASGEAVLRIETSAGSLLGLPGLISNFPYTLTATARAGSEVSCIRRPEFTALMQADPLLALKILQVLAAEVRSAREAYMDASKGQPRGAASA